MEKIKYFGKRTLDTFIISLSYEDLLPGLKLKDIYPFAEAIQGSFPTQPTLGLLKRRFTQINLAPFTFWDENKKNRVEIGQDFLVFTFTDYLKWDKELPKVTKVFNALNDILDLPNINKIVLTYIDLFPIPREEFNYNRYFTMPNFDIEHEWEIKFHDFVLGIVPFDDPLDEEKKKIVLRLKSIPQDHNDTHFNFRLETIGSVDNFSMTPDIEILCNHLDDCHNRIEDCFIKFLTAEYRSELALDVVPYQE